jgi:MSHA pilin protein MshA
MAPAGPATQHAGMSAGPAPAPLARRAAAAPARGFSLIEQLTALSVSGLLAASALPALTALNDTAQDTSLAVLAHGAASAMAMNQAGCLLTGQRHEAGKCQPVRDCADVAGLLATDLPAGYAVTPQPLPPGGARCTLLRTQDGATAGFHGAAAGG